MADLKDLAVPKGSLALVTGVNSFIGSHVADQFLQFGYKVRGTVRDLEKNTWLDKFFGDKFGNGKFELVRVTDMAAEDALDEAIKGVAIVAHTASVMTLDPNPHNVVPLVIDYALNAVKAAYREPSVKRFVFTSSSSAAVDPVLGRPGITVTEKTWNENSVEEAWAEPPYHPARGMAVYAASKTRAEQEVWKFYEEHRRERPDLVLNTILPSVNFGKPLDPVNQGHRSTSSFVASLWNGEIFLAHPFFPRQHYVNVQDTARLHVAAAILPSVKDRRIFAFAGRFNWDTVLAILRKIAPERTLPGDFSGGDDPNEIEPRGEAEKILCILGRSGWVGLEESIADNVQGL